MTVAEALTLARSLGVDALDAKLLLARLLGQDRGWLITHDDAPVDESALRPLLERRAAGEPFAYIVGEQEFHGLLLKVTPATLIPRADTETLVDWALELLVPGTRVVDLGTGSGAIALALKHRKPTVEVHAVDLSEAALAVAQANAARLGLCVTFHAGSWLAPLARQRFSMIVSNPPYIAAEDPHLDSLGHEPISALTPGGNGLSDLQTIVQAAPDHLEPGGWLLLEHGHDQADAVATLLRQRGFSTLSLRRDLGGNPRASGGRWL
ncbi:MAG: peptide chain release factor N(5)-glutamine methyltransferase [Paucibacter sp.]|nr:peptide chain release factor N(5)-glutamine methyltransferase [Roseateles sp.]